jgi:N-acyl amino acid synthase of PEP-CTERM/exosortase system
MRDILVPYFGFGTVLRGNPESLILRDIYRLRHAVYCQQSAALPALDSAAGEADQFDAGAIHVAGWSPGGALLGAARLLRPEPGQPFPFQRHCKVFAGFCPPPPGQAAELSRLVVSGALRRRRGDSAEGIAQAFAERGTTAAIGPPGATRDPRNNSPLLLLGLYRELYRHSRANGVRYWYAAIDRPLARALETMGFKFLPIGPQTELDGPVTPHMADLDDVAQRLRTENPFLAAWLGDQPLPLWIRLKALCGSALRR